MRREPVQTLLMLKSFTAFVAILVSLPAQSERGPLTVEVVEPDGRPAGGALVRIASEGTRSLVGDFEARRDGGFHERRRPNSLLAGRDLHARRFPKRLRVVATQRPPARRRRALRRRRPVAPARGPGPDRSAADRIHRSRPAVDAGADRGVGAKRSIPGDRARHDGSHAGRASARF